MKLFEHPEFEQAILRAAEFFHARGLRPAIIEKDYYVTEALRIIAVASGGGIIFKGGTSLSKGWNLIHRFSEDIDIFLDPLAFQPALGKNRIDRELKKLRDAVGATRRSHLPRTRAKPSAVSGVTTASRTLSASAGPVRLPIGFCLKRAPRAAVSRRLLSISVRTSASF